MLPVKRMLFEEFLMKRVFACLFVSWESGVSNGYMTRFSFKVCFVSLENLVKNVD